MAAATGSSISLNSASLSLNKKQVGSKISNVNSVSLSVNVKSFRSSRLRSSSQRFHVSCAAKPETVDKVCKIVRKQLALSDDTKVTGESKFATLGADSLDTVEVVMGIEEEFGISVEEESAQSILSIQDAADLVEKIISNDSSPPKV